MFQLIAIVGPNAGTGHGECFIWKTSTRDRAIAIDAGGTIESGREAASHNPKILILSHDDSDHIGGAVTLIKEAKIEELWVPTEWAVLIKQIASTTQENLFSGDGRPVSPEDVRELIEQQIIVDGGNDGGVLTLELIKSAQKNVDTWHEDTKSEDESSRRSGGRVYGARNWAKVIARVRARTHVIAPILREALRRSVQIRYFSIDLMLNRPSKEWKRAGHQGEVTIANASLAPNSLAVTLPPGIQYSWALSRLSVQNRRALSTLLWTNTKDCKNAVAVWSDTDGNWLDHTTARGFGAVVKSLIASSAPHHGSRNPEHDRIWKELTNAPPSLVMIAAGGHWAQNPLHAEYIKLGNRRACTWCRKTPNIVQQVSADDINGTMALFHQCLRVH